MSQITVYVDGACKGNPGLGGWGVYIEWPDGQAQDFYGGAEHTTNNRMELTAAIQALAHTPKDQAVVIWTDSSYVQQGISQWVHGWKKNNWRKADGKAVINADLWQQLDQACQNRLIEWRWIKGHAGHAGNERADQLANQGVIDPHGKQYATPTISVVAAPDPIFSSSTPSLPDWLMDDPLGFDLALADEAEWIDAENAGAIDESLVIDTHMPSTSASALTQGLRQLILDTETTGFDPHQGDRVIEIGVLELINRKPTGNRLHLYLNPHRPVGDSVHIHGLTDDFLADKPTFDQVAQQVQQFLCGAEVIAHNASFDMNFLDAEFERCGLGKITTHIMVTDTLAMAKRKYPGQKNSLDALVKRCDIKPRDRHYHGALLDAEILTDVYLAMTGGQVSLDMGEQDHSLGEMHHKAMQTRRLVVVHANAEESAQHQAWLHTHDKSGQGTLWQQLGLA